jgi:hypothetical protein
MTPQERREYMQERRENTAGNGQNRESQQQGNNN